MQWQYCAYRLIEIYPNLRSTLAEEPETIHDFYGFLSELYRIKYPAQGSPTLAKRVAALLQSASIDCDIGHRYGLDHGDWVPMMLMYPNAEVPIVQLSIQHSLYPAERFAIGRAVSDLRQ